MRYWNTRYDRLDALETLRDRLGVRTGSSDTKLPGLWVLVPQDGQQKLPVLGGKAVPVITGAQWTRLTWAWLENRHRSNGGKGRNQ